MKPLRAAIIGCGGIAHQHAKRLAVLDDVELVGFCDNVVQKADAFNEQYAGGEAQVYTEYTQMFKDLPLDMVHICLPPFAHGNDVELACEHGVHFLIEKPIALTMDKASAMAAAVAQSGVKSQVGFMFRFGDAVQKLKTCIKKMEVSQGYFTGRYFCNSLHAEWWRDRTRSGGQIFEQVIHIFDLARALFGEPAHVYSMQNNLFHQDVADYTVEDASSTVVRFAGGGMATIIASNGAIPNQWVFDMRVMLPGLTADFEDANHAVFHHTAQTSPITTTIASEKDVYLAETLDLIAAIRDDRSTIVPIEEGVRSLAFVTAATESATTGLPVDLI
jgi:predicted dehydrogenase